MDLFSPAPTPADLRTRGFTAALRIVLGLGLLGLSITGMFFGFSWISGSIPLPAEMPSRGGGPPLPFAEEDAWLVAGMSTLFFPLFIAGIITEFQRALRAYKSRTHIFVPPRDKPFHRPKQAKSLIKKK
jgi:hypothetical protein